MKWTAVVACAGMACAHAQLVESPAQAPAAKKKVSAPNAGRGAQVREAKASPGRGLASFGITPRSLVAWKHSGSRDEITFKLVNFQRNSGGDHGMPLFEMRGRDAFEQSDRMPNLAMVRLGPSGPEMSLNSQSGWVRGEKRGQEWVFAYERDLVTVKPVGEKFSPTVFKSWAFERGAVVRSTACNPNELTNPYYHSMVIAVAMGDNEIEGIVKFPGATFAAPFKGVRHEGKWIARTTESYPYSTRLFTGTHGSSFGSQTGSNGINTDRYRFQIEISDSRILLGEGSHSANYALDGDVTDQFEAAMDFEMSTAKELTPLAAAYKVNFGRSLWTKSDEVGSFSRDADKAYAAGGMKVWLWDSYASTGNGWGAHRQRARESADPIVRRIAAVGGEVAYLQYNGEPLGGGGKRPSALMERMGKKEALDGNAKSLPVFPLAVINASGFLATLHTPNELRLWSPNMKGVSGTQALPPGQAVSSASVSADGSRFTTTSNLGVCLWSVNPLRPMFLPMDKCSNYYSSVFSPNGSLVAGGGIDGKTRIYQLPAGKLLATTSGESSWSGGFSLSNKPRSHRGRQIVALDFSPDGKLLVEGSAEGHLRVWDISGSSEIKKVKAVDFDDLDGIWKVKFIHGGRELMVLCQTGAYRILDTSNWKVSGKVDNTLPPATSVLFSQDGESMTTCHMGGRVVRTVIASGAIDGDVTIDGLAIGVLTQMGDSVFVLKEREWKKVNL